MAQGGLEGALLQLEAAFKSLARGASAQRVAAVKRGQLSLRLIGERLPARARRQQRCGTFPIQADDLAGLVQFIQGCGGSFGRQAGMGGGL